MLTCPTDSDAQFDKYTMYMRLVYALVYQLSVDWSSSTFQPIKQKYNGQVYGVQTFGNAAGTEGILLYQRFTEAGWASVWDTCL